MKRFKLRLRQLSQQFWFIPALMTVLALVLAECGITLEERVGVPDGLNFLYGGGESGARSVLAAVAGSSIGVAGTVFSITIAALSYAAGSMGPRLLDNFVKDRGNQVTLGIFIATFTFSLYTLRAVTGSDSNPFVPHYNVSAAMGLALMCIAALVYYLAHVTASINMTHVINLLRDDLTRTLEQATQGRAHASEPGLQSDSPLPNEAFWQSGEALRTPKGGYLQLVDLESLLQQVEQADVTLRLSVRVGDYVFPNTVIAHGVPRLPPKVLAALTLGNQRTTGQDLEYSVRQLSEVAVRALSPGTNDPTTAIDVIDRFGDALCTLHDREWHSGVWVQRGRLRLVMRQTDFGGLLDSMFRMIRQYGKDSPAVGIHLLEVLTQVASTLSDPARQSQLKRHADLIREDALGKVSNSADRSDLEQCYRNFIQVLHQVEQVVA